MKFKLHKAVVSRGKNHVCKNLHSVENYFTHYGMYIPVFEAQVPAVLL